MKRLFAVVLLMMMLLPTACKRHTVIPDDELALIIHDAFLTNAYIDSKGVESDSMNLYAPIFARYGYTTEDVQYTIGNFSKRKSARLSDVVEAAIDLLEEEGKHYDREVRILDTIRQVALRSTAQLIVEDTLIRVRSLRDTARLQLRIPVEVGEYEVSYEYEIDSLDRNTRLQRRFWLEMKDATRQHIQHTTLRRNTKDRVIRKYRTDSTAKELHLDLLYFPDKPKQPSITVRNLRIKYTLNEKEAIHRLYEQQMNLRIFSNHFLRAAREKDSL